MSVKRHLIASLPHSGTHTLLHFLVQKTGASSNPDVTYSENIHTDKDDALITMAHINRYPTFTEDFMLEDIGRWTRGREVWTPVRDPNQLAWSYINVHGHTEDNLLAWLARANRFVEEVDPILVNIMPMTAKNVKGTHESDPQLGSLILRLFPKVFDYGNKRNQQRLERAF